MKLSACAPPVPNGSLSSLRAPLAQALLVRNRRNETVEQLGQDRRVDRRQAGQGGEIETESDQPDVLGEHRVGDGRRIGSSQARKTSASNSAALASCSSESAF